jgi:site-specific DNA-methyltransferase (adenine-specific)
VTPYYEQDSISIYHGDCREVLPALGGIDAVVSDPPYGVNLNTRYQRFTGGNRRMGGTTEFRRNHKPIENDDRPFDPSPWLAFPKVILFGFQCFNDRLPPGTALVWLKKSDSKIGKFLSDCENWTPWDWKSDRRNNAAAACRNTPSI